MSIMLEILMAPFFAIVDFVLGAPVPAIATAACLIGALAVTLVTIA